MLSDGRILVVEYKSKHLIDYADTKKKLAIGKLWESKSAGKGLFLMAEKVKDGLMMDEQINAPIER